MTYTDKILPFSLGRVPLEEGCADLPVLSRVRGALKGESLLLGDPSLDMWVEIRYAQLHVSLHHQIDQAFLTFLTYIKKHGYKAKRF